MKRYNIFLNNKEREKLNHIKKTHNLSYSTIIDIVIRNYQVFQPFTQDIQKYANNLKDLTKNRKKTSIKIKNLYNLSCREINCLLFYFIYEKDKEITDINLTHEQLMKIQQTIRKSINRDFQTTIDQWVFYNQYCRMKERYQRENEN